MPNPKSGWGMLVYALRIELFPGPSHPVLEFYSPQRLGFCPRRMRFRFAI